MILVFKEFLQTSMRPLISVLYAKGYHDFLLKNICLTGPKNFVEEPFCVSENLWYRKMLGIREGAGVTIFCQNCFVSVPKNFVGEPFCFTKFLVSKKFMDKRGGGEEAEGSITHNFLSKIFCLSAEKFRRGTLLCCVSENFRLRKSLWIRGVRGSIKIFRQKFLVSQCRKMP